MAEDQRTGAQTGEAGGGTSVSKDRVTVRAEELTLSNTLQLTAIVELLEERGIMTQGDVIERVKAIRDRKEMC